MPKNTKLLIIFLTTATIVLVLILVFKPKNQSEPIPKEVPSPRITIPTGAPIFLPTPEGSGQNTISKVDLINLLPVQEEEFNIEYLSFDQTILVTIKKGPALPSLQEAEAWFKERGITNFKQYQIEWVISPELREQPIYN